MTKEQAIERALIELENSSQRLCLALAEIERVIIEEFNTLSISTKPDEKVLDN